MTAAERAAKTLLRSEHADVIRSAVATVVARPTLDRASGSLIVKRGQAGSLRRDLRTRPT